MNTEQQLIPEHGLRAIKAVLSNSKEPFWEETTPQTALWHCMLYIAKKLKTKLKPMEPVAKITLDELTSLCRTSQMQMRQIELSGLWWKRDVGPILAFYESFDHPAALIPRAFNRYLLLVPSKHIRCYVTKKVALKLLNKAMMFYKTLAEKKLSWFDLGRFGFTNLGKDVFTIFLTQAVIALLAFILPIVMGLIFEHIIPNTSYSLLKQLTILLAINVVVMTLFNTILMLSTLRLRLKITASLQAAIWDRVIRLPIQFFRQFTAGDLANRASGIDHIQQTMTNSVLNSISGGLLALVSLGLMFYYSPPLTLATIILVFILSFITLLANLRQIHYLRKSALLQGKLTGFVLQIITAMTKIKTTNSAARIFVQWARPFSEKNLMLYQAGKIVVRLSVFSSAFSVFSTITLFVLVILFSKNLSFGHFITISVLFSQCIAAMISMESVLSSIIAVVPLAERIRPIMNTLPESEHGVRMEVLTGKIDLINIHFQYKEDAPVVFKNLNMNIKPQEIVALVGSSGCGKSSLFRLLLGLESAQSGKIYYSDMELSSINIRSIREQIGVVLQDSVLFPGSLLENILGYGQDYDISEIEQLIEHVCLTEDINQMPMGLDTVITEKGKTLSNGQRQRVLLARALYKKPNLLLLDEATSALDNITQEKIYSYLSSLGITCLIIAHRLSTLEFTDRIYVLDNGIAAQSGTLQQLLKEEGLFKKMVFHDKR